MKQPTAILTFATLSALHARTKQPVELTPPSGWICEYKSQILGMIHSYSFTKTPVVSGSLMLFGCPSIEKEKVPALLQEVATGFMTELENMYEAPLTIGDYEMMDFGDDYSSAQCLAFTVTEEKREVLVRAFIIRNEQVTWIGQFTGSEKGWAEGFEILTALKTTFQKNIYPPLHAAI